MSVDRSGGHEPLFAAFVGIDWADQKHVWSLQQIRRDADIEFAAVLANVSRIARGSTQAKLLSQS
jgi:hypothetical protein